MTTPEPDAHRPPGPADPTAPRAAPDTDTTSAPASPADMPNAIDAAGAVDANPAGPADTIVGVIGADRLCVRCGYNLINQPIVRESTYDMIIARCSECGTVAAVQEYPAVGRWANRFTAAGAVLWFLLVIATVAGGSALMATAAFATQDVQRWPFTRVLEGLHRADEPASFEDGNRSDTVFDWFSSQSPDSLRERVQQRKLDGDSRFDNGPPLWFPALFFAIALAAIGTIGAVLLPNQGRRGLIVVGLAMTALSGGTLFLIDIAELDTSWFDYSDVYYRLHGRRIMAITAVAMSGVAIAGLLIGRPVMRGLVRLGIPPRLRGPLAFLWTADGRPLPPGIRRSRGPQPL
ncbi:MAG: hypothetical protein AB8G96_00760 [Phycisphaerales bacterium]